MSATQAALGAHQLAATLEGGLDTLSEIQTITFTRYKRLILPLDGYVFWVRSSLINVSAAPNAFQGNEVVPNQPTAEPGRPHTFVAKGSMHYATIANQNEDDSSGTNQIIFTSQVEVEDLNEVDPDEMWIGEWQGVRFSFARRDSFYEQARLHHYRGVAIYSAMESQIIDTPAGFSQAQIVSNSLPVWLSLAQPVAPVVGLAGIDVPIYPSFLVGQNIVPPYIAVHIYPEATEAWQASPLFDRTSSQWQLTRDRVRITLYGFRNEQALAFVDYVQRFCLFTEVMGISNMPIVRDEKRTQVELGILAQKKTIEFEVNYYQAAMRNLARQLILSAPITVQAVPPLPLEPARWNEFRWNDGATWQ